MGFAREGVSDSGGSCQRARVGAAHAGRWASLWATLRTTVSEGWIEMALLDDIQAAVLEEGADLGPILLKVRLLAARLGSQPLADWVKHESEGYPPDSPLPDYRIIPVSYTGSFSGPFGSGIRNAPIPPYLIEKFAGEKWTRYKMRQSIAAVDDLLASAKDGGSFISTPPTSSFCFKAKCTRTTHVIQS